MYYSDVQSDILFSYIGTYKNHLEYSLITLAFHNNRIFNQKSSYIHINSMISSKTQDYKMFLINSRVNLEWNITQTNGLIKELL